MSLERQLRWLDSQVSLAATGLPNAGDVGALSVAPMAELVALLGDPQADAPVIHLTGTNGKGSTAHMLTLLLREHGLRVGTYGSPHVSRINERIQIDGEPIDDDTLADVLAVVRLAADQVHFKPSWFELLTAAGYRAFSDAAVDVMVIEVGMLGRYDATNIVDSAVSVVTNISMDHTDGGEGWRDKVAHEKAGIVSPGSTLVIGDVERELHHHFIDEGPGSVLRFGDQYELLANDIGVGGRVIDVQAPRDRYEAVLVSMHGRHQGLNATIAIVTAEAFLDAPLDRTHLDSALGQASLPGRFEVLAVEPLVIIDGAHNPGGAESAAETFVSGFHIFGRRILVVGMMADKDPVRMLEALDATEAELVVCCQPDWPRAMPASELAAAARELGIEPEVMITPVEAIELALSLSTEGDAILVVGSLYIAGAVRNHLQVDP